MRRDAEGLAFGGVAALAVMAAALGLGLLPLLTAPVVRAIANDRALAARTSLPAERALEAAEMVREYVTSPSGRRLPYSYYGRDAFDQRAAIHLDDVRRAISGGLGAALAACLALAGALALGWRRGRLADVGSGMRAGGIALPAALAVAAVTAAVAFDAVFTAFHTLFFDPGTWTFAADDLLILLFPERFWAIAGGSWAVLASVMALGAAWAGSTIREAQARA